MAHAQEREDKRRPNS